MAGTMDFLMADMYPQMFSGAPETSTAVTPDADDQTALSEDKNVAETLDRNTPNTIRVIISVVFVIILVVLFGVGD